jgi:hypothetical protein
MSNVVCVYCTLHPATRAALSALAGEVRYRDTSAGDHAYYRVLEEFWGTGGDLVIIEQDIVVQRDTIPGLLACPHPWCTFGYWLFGNLPGGARWTDFALGCARFSASLMEHVPLSRIAGQAHEPGTARDLRRGRSAADPTAWWNLDTSVADCLRRDIELAVHCHGEVEHAHDYYDDAYGGDQRRPLPGIEQRRQIFAGEIPPGISLRRAQPVSDCPAHSVPRPGCPRCGIKYLLPEDIPEDAD